MKAFLQQALDALTAIHPEFICQAAHHKKKDQHAGLSHCPVAERHQAAIAALQAALDAPESELFGWMVSGVPTVMRGSLAEAIQKNEAKRIGGTCVAFPVYAHPDRIAAANRQAEATDWSAA